MIDIHSHLIFGVDDGASTIDESINMLIEAEKLGIKVIIATPHLEEKVYENKHKYENFQTLKKNAENKNIDLKYGAEVFLNPFLPDMLGEKRSLTLNNSKYMLVEFPYNSIPYFSHETIYNLQIKNICPIIAHPERNWCFNKNMDLLLPFFERGCLIQIDAASIMGVYGKHVKSFTKQLLKLEMAHFVASDAHCPADYTNWYSKAYKQVEKWVGKEYANRLYVQNPQKILDNTE